MSSRREIALSRSTEWAGEEIRFLPAIRDVDAEWLWLDMAQSPNGDLEALARIAGRIGQLNPGTSSASDSVADWVAFQRHCVELLRALLITRKEIFPSEVSGSLWLLHAVSAPTPPQDMGEKFAQFPHKMGTSFGEVAEWFKATVLKIVEGLSPP